MSDRYWDKPWSLVDGCTPCSPGCDHCWSASMAHRFYREHLTTTEGKFNGHVRTRPDRLDIPLRTRKPTVYSIWNDLFHEDVPDSFRDDAYAVMHGCDRHTYLILTKRADRLLEYSKTHFLSGYTGRDHIWHGTTVCNQAEADEKIPYLLKVPGKRWVSIEPMLGPVDIVAARFRAVQQGATGGIHAVVLGSETGPGARPLHPDWVRKVRDDCSAAGVPFFFKQWGEWAVINRDNWLSRTACHVYRSGRVTKWDGAPLDDDPAGMVRVGSKRAGRLLDGKEHNDLPWRKAQ